MTNKTNNFSSSETTKSDLCKTTTSLMQNYKSQLNGNLLKVTKMRSVIRWLLSG